MISRRDFSVRLAGILAVAGGPGHLLDAQESAAKPSASPTSSSPVAEEGLSQNEQQEVESRYQNVIRAWGDRLSSEQRERVRRVLVANSRMMQPMRALQLQNGDPPAQVLRVTADRGPAADRKPDAGQDRSE
ncbi:MAG TPA: hypothetical protein VJR04_05255 [Terriglobales bacterium]|nr:hypothetical protein [Terriglobales bacterium]